jgi:2-oxoglutarate-Fe(II)-dependent dioxygenase family protein
VLTELRVRTRLAEPAVRELAGKCPGDPDYDVLLTGPARVVKLDGRPLCVYLPGALTQALDAPGVYDILHSLRDRLSRNRGQASGTIRFRSRQKRSYTKPIASTIIGAIDPGGQQRYCRLTSWTGQNLPAWARLRPLLAEIAGHLAEQVPDRYCAQQAQADLTDPAWTVPGTPFSTVTVNNTFATGIHTDKGDLDAGFSTLAVLRRGAFTGGRLVFPAYRVAADLAHGDLLLMDAHDWHGNTPITCACGTTPPGAGPCEACGAERISLVCYFRTKLTQCGTPDQEHTKGSAYHERTSAPAGEAAP